MFSIIGYYVINNNSFVICLKWSESHSVASGSLWPHGLYIPWILQARILQWVSFPFSRGSSQPRDRTRVSCIAGGFFTSWATRKAHQSPPLSSNTILQPQLETCFLCSNIWTAKTGDKGHKINWEWAPRMISAVPDCFSSYPHNNCPKQPRTLPSGLPSLHPF